MAVGATLVALSPDDEFAMVVVARGVNGSKVEPRNCELRVRHRAGYPSRAPL